VRELEPDVASRRAGSASCREGDRAELPRQLGLDALHVRLELDVRDLLDQVLEELDAEVDVEAIVPRVRMNGSALATWYGCFRSKRSSLVVVVGSLSTSTMNRPRLALVEVRVESERRPESLELVLTEDERVVADVGQPEERVLLDVVLREDVEAALQSPVRAAVVLEPEERAPPAP
jgi:hypothetical protein